VISSARLHAARAQAESELLAARNQHGVWIGELSSSALSTATAIAALAIFEKESKVQSPKFKVGASLEISNLTTQIETGLKWLAQNVNADGGWGDTTKSLSNLSTTTLCWAAFGAVPGADEKYRALICNAEAWLKQHLAEVDVAAKNKNFSTALVGAIVKRYNNDRTFSIPILTMCALAGRLGSGAEAWRDVLPLPFELAALPRSWFAAIGLPVVSYALPALIAIGQARHFHRPGKNIFARSLRNFTRSRTLKILEKIQPAGGGFLEATPLTSFVVMSLAGSGQVNHGVTKNGLDFLLRSQRADGSWPIDTNLATWLTTLSINALGAESEVQSPKSKVQSFEGDALCDWLLKQQFRSTHSYTGAAPGGWAWTDLPGGVPDADDTAGALLALRKFSPDEPTRAAAFAGINWLLQLQNRDGGIPTFCRGWGKLQFDRSSPDLTAHAIRAWLEWFEEFPPLQKKIARAIERAFAFLQRTQRPDGAWSPLWFGNQFAADEENLTYGTSRVLLALAENKMKLAQNSAANLLCWEMLARAVNWLVAAQNGDGSWSGFVGGPTSIEETACAVEALAAVAASQKNITPELEVVLARGTNWLLAKVESGEWKNPAPIGFYFAKLWYYEKLYPQIFTVAALNRIMQTPLVKA